MPDLFQPYTGQQVQPVPPGYIQAFSQAGAELGNGLSALGAGVGEGVAKWKQQQLQAKSADYFIKSYDGKDPVTGETKNPILDQMGLHPEQWSTLGAREKTAAVAGIMQGRQAQTASMEAQAKAGDLQAQTAARLMMEDEAGAMGKLAPKVADWAQQNPGKPVTPSTILSLMGGVNMNPREQAVIMGKMMSGMGGDGAATPQPQPWKSPAGNNYVTYGKEIMPDRAPFDPNTFMGGGGGTDTGTGGAGVPAGYSAVPDGRGGVRYLQEPKATPKTLSPAMQTLLMKHLDDFNEAGTRLQAPDDALQASGLDPKTVKASLATKQKTALKNGQTLIDTQFKLGNLTADERDSFYQSFGINPPGAGNTGSGTAKGAAAGAGPAAAGGRIPVWKDGKQFTVPAAQKDAAAAAGYSLTAPAAQ